MLDRKGQVWGKFWIGFGVFSPMIEHVECVVIGAGVVGLAIARSLALSGRDVVLLEKAEAIGTETSSRHSEVIHAGIYYPENSLKARFCVIGRNSLYAFCDDHGVEYNKCGKIIVATDSEQIAQLRQIKSNAANNGVDDLIWLEPSDVLSLEPSVFCVGALWSPSTGVLDSHGFMLALLGDAQAAGAMLALQTPVIGGALVNKGIRLDCGGESPISLVAKNVINSAGLWAQEIVRHIQGFSDEKIPATHFCKGNYYSLKGKAPFSRPIYPVPEDGGLGIHATVDLAGQVRFGPDVEWINEINYEVDSSRAERFYDVIRNYYPELPNGALQPGYAGVRPKLHPAGQGPRDFMVQDVKQHGIAGLINLFGIESPGMTSSLAIAKHVLNCLETTH